MTALTGWFDQAHAGDRIEYARGIDLPREEAGVLLVQRWIREGAVRPFFTRDPDNAAVSVWIVERVTTAPVQPQGQPDLADLQMKALLRALTGAAVQGEACPSRGKLAIEATGQRSERAKERVRWLMKRLEADGKIAVEPAPRGAQHGPVVTILTGRHAGKSTRRMV
ncbi:hypothetical protein ACLBKU_11920 [Erythrobacter sp. NE805]|uniref:hypothetical protein n=1 Tax=Erythrobacter sp. NE805 TaxID=3389875 RepID=UPI00396B3D1D